MTPPAESKGQKYAAKTLTSQQKAALRAEEIRLGLQSTGVLYALAVKERDWDILHYESVGAWAAGEFGPDRFNAERRQEIVKFLTQAGLTQRAIAAATNSSHQTVGRDQRANASVPYDGFGEGQGPPAGVPVRAEPMEELAPPRPAGSPRQTAARDREANLARARAGLPRDASEAPHAHVFDRCACGAKRP
jgi:hypothetical protein